MAGDATKSKKYIELAQKAGLQIEDEGNREYFLSELGSISELLVELEA